MSTHDAMAGRAGHWAPATAACSTLGVLALPKCPACIAGYLYVLGLGAGVTGTVALLVKPTLITVAFVAAAAAVIHRVLRHRRRSAAGPLRRGRRPPRRVRAPARQQSRRS